MKGNQYSYISFNYNYRRDDDLDLDFSRKEYKTQNKEFNLQKYQKFKPKNTENYYYKKKTLKGAENKVKNLLSLFLKNYENEENSDIYNELNKTKKNTNNNQKRLKKVKTALSNKKLKTKYLDDLNNNQKDNNIINTPDEIEYYKNQKGNNKYNIINSLNNTYQDGKRIKRNKTCGKIKKKYNNNNLNQNTSSKNILVNRTNYSYLNFKNGINESQKPNYNLFGFKTSLKMKKGILKTNNKINIFNDSSQNTLLTDLSNYSLIKKSSDRKTRFKDDESPEKEKKKKFPSFK